jgi:hypothetical protein
MRLLLLFIFTFYLNTCLAQHVQKTKQQIDTIVNAVARNKHANHSSFIKKINKKTLYYYSYIADATNVLMISLSFRNGNDKVERVFYLHHNKLIYSTESIVSYYTTANVTDSIGWGGAYYFSNNKLISIVTLGHGKSETDNWDPQTEVLANCNHARMEVMKHRLYILSSQK